MSARQIRITTAFTVRSSVGTFPLKVKPGEVYEISTGSSGLQIRYGAHVFPLAQDEFPNVEFM